LLRRGSGGNVEFGCTTTLLWCLGQDNLGDIRHICIPLCTVLGGAYYETHLVGAKLYKEFLSSDQASCLVIEGLMLEAVGEIARTHAARDRRPPRWLEQSRELIREDFLKCLTLSDIAEAVDVHPVHPAQSFRKFYYCTIGDYVRSLRIGFACRQLRQPEIPLSEIAFHAGFADQSHFTRTFKKTFGVPPSQYRREMEKTDISGPTDSAKSIRLDPM
jgi:AraC-like DNA-binding protein